MATPVTTTTTVVSETKPGIRTTEFWLTLALQIVFLLNTTEIWTYMPQKYSALVQAVVGAAYVLSRGEAKKGIPFQEQVESPAS